MATQEVNALSQRIIYDEFVPFQTIVYVALMEESLFEPLMIGMFPIF